MSIIQKICIWALPLLLAIVFHEVAHGWIAYKFGDKTALMLGRLTLNPIKHIDPVGTLLVPGILLITSTMMGAGGIIFGWAKPVPVNARNFRNPRRDMAIVSIAGPMANLVMAFFWALVLKLAIVMTQDVSGLVAPLILMAQAGILINLMLMILNLIPILPLDGGQFVSNLLPPKIAYYFDKVEPFGLLLLLVLLITGVLGAVLIPILYMIFNLILTLFGLGG